ncbi:hypothetical protein EB118_20535, partial [bacterium]|nr:hypothetical protein [bacterium]
MKKQEEDFDFGFTTIDDPSTDLEAISFQLDDYKTRLQKMYDAIIPLLNNLEKNADQEMIKWPNRDKKLKNLK